jgi:hypothetical protein
MSLRTLLIYHVNILVSQCFRSVCFQTFRRCFMSSHGSFIRKC